MNKDTVKGQWNEIIGKLREQWAKISENDFEMLKATYQEMKGELQKKYGEKKEAAKKARHATSNGTATKSTATKKKVVKPKIVKHKVDKK